MCRTRLSFPTQKQSLKKTGGDSSNLMNGFLTKSTGPTCNHNYSANQIPTQQSSQLTNPFNTNCESIPIFQKKNHGRTGGTNCAFYGPNKPNSQISIPTGPKSSQLPNFRGRIKLQPLCHHFFVVNCHYINCNYFVLHEKHFLKLHTQFQKHISGLILGFTGNLFK